MYTSTTTTPATTSVTESRSRTKIALWWMPTFLGFPAGGLLAEVVGRVDAPGPAIAGGAITGAVLGFAQWLGMRRTGPSPLAWIIATAVGFSAGLAVGAASVGYDTSTGALATQGLICGAVLGAVQATVLHRTFGRLAAVWPVLIAGLWALGWTITASAGIDVEAQYTSFGASGAIVATAAMAILPIELARRRSSECFAPPRVGAKHTDAA
jgi:FtsH-binding integral membrane protein